MKENKPTLAFVFLVLMGLLWLFISEAGIPTGRLCFYAGLLIFETWTIANKRKGDTISEAVWELSARPLVPFILGCIVTYYIQNGTISHPIEIAGIMGLVGHLAWQADSVYRDIQKREEA